MKNSRKVKFLIIFLFIIEMISLFFTIKSFLNKNIAETKEIYEIDKKQFSMYIENEEGNYEEYVESNKFPEGYQINIEKSKCVDTKGNVINGILTGNGTNITITSSKTSYCYLYFDIKELTASEYLIENVSSDMLWDSTLEDDGYRYVGTNPDNYICFGTTNQSDCKNAPDKYMYRIIGIFESEDGTQHLKLIKKEALNTTYEWTGNSNFDIEWNASSLYEALTGTYFVNNTEYSYMQDNNWYSKIAIWNYIGTGTQTFYNGGPSYNSETAKNIYLHEMNRSGKTSTLGVWTTISSKIGLMYVSDYLLSLGSSALNYTPNSNYSTLKTGWMHLSNNDSEAPNSVEWTMTRSGGDSAEDEDSYYFAWNITSTGSISHGNGTDDYYSSRPVFYLTSDITISGEGTTTNPYIIG